MKYIKFEKKIMNSGNFFRRTFSMSRNFAALFFVLLLASLVPTDYLSSLLCNLNLLRASM